MSTLKNQPQKCCHRLQRTLPFWVYCYQTTLCHTLICSVCRFPIFLYIDSLLLLLISLHLQQSIHTFIYTYIYLYIPVCQHTPVHIPPRHGYIKTAKEWIWPALSDSSNISFLFNTKIWDVLLLFSSHTNVIVSLITWMLLTSMAFLPQSVLFQEAYTAQED